MPNPCKAAAGAVAGAVRIHASRGESRALLEDIARTAGVGMALVSMALRKQGAEVSKLAGRPVRLEPEKRERWDARFARVRRRVVYAVVWDE